MNENSGKIFFIQIRNSKGFIWYERCLNYIYRKKTFKSMEQNK